MPQIGWFEILIIVLIAILILGPKDFPIMLKKAGSWIGSLKKYFSDFQSDIQNMGDEFDDNISDEIDTDITKPKKKTKDD